MDNMLAAIGEKEIIRMIEIIIVFR